MMEFDLALLTHFVEFMTSNMFKKEALRGGTRGDTSSRLGDQGRYSSRDEHLQDHEEEDGHLLLVFEEIDVYQNSPPSPDRGRD